MKKYYMTFLLLLVMLTFISCAHQPPVDDLAVPGFFKGIWHGFIAPFALIISIFTDIRIYAFPNGGFWYDFGYVLGFMIIAGGGGGASARKKR